MLCSLGFLQLLKVAAGFAHLFVGPLPLTEMGREETGDNFGKWRC